METAALAVAVFGVSLGAIALWHSFQRVSGMNALLEEAQGRFDAFLVAQKSRMNDANAILGRLSNADKKADEIAAQLEDIKSQVEGGLDDKLDARLRPIESQLNQLSLLAGMPRRKVYDPASDGTPRKG